MTKINPYVGEITERVYKTQVLELFAINKWLSSFFIVAPHILFIAFSRNVYSFIVLACHLPNVLIALEAVLSTNSVKERTKHLFKLGYYNYIGIAIYSLIYIYYEVKFGSLITPWIRLNKDDYCAISYEQFKESEVVMACTQCTSVYKKSQITMWFAKCGNTKCPMCRHNHLKLRVVKHKT